MKPGYLYVLVHPSDPDLYKIGVTIKLPEKRLAEHNRNLESCAGRIVKETGQAWELKTYIAVPDPYRAERAFWGATHFPDIPYLRGVEVHKMEWKLVQAGLDAAKKAGVRPPQQEETFPDHVYAYTASIRKRLEGRGITLLGYVRSIVSGKANFRCSNGHEWRTAPMDVGEGQGCPKCEIGHCDPEEIRRRIRPGVICLLTHPDQPGFVKIGAGYGTLDEVCDEWPWVGWDMHRYRNVDEVALAESVIWELLGAPLPHGRDPIKKDLKEAEDAFRSFIYTMRERIALAERAKDAVRESDEA